jgi:hypothetical protein
VARDVAHFCKEFSDNLPIRESDQNETVAQNIALVDKMDEEKA